MSNFASHAIPVVPTGPDAPVEQKPGINPIASIPDGTPRVATPPERPAYLPEKFKSPEEMAAAYAELEKKLGQQPPANTEPKAPEPKPAEQKPTDQKPAELPAELPPQFAKFNSEFADKGQLSEESYQELATKHGLSKEYVDVYISGLQAKQADYTKSVAEAAGGEEQLNSLFEWAGKSLSDAELVAANRALASGDKATAALAVRGLAARYADEFGSEPRLLAGAAPSASGPVPFNSTKEVVRAMSDPRYTSDPAYRAEIEARLDVSTVI